MKNISIKIPDELYEAIGKSAKERKQTISYFIRDTMTMYVAEAPREDSFYTMAEDLSGCLTAPADLASNTSYLEEYGK